MTSQTDVQKGIEKIIDYKLQGKLSKAQIALVKQSAQKQLSELQKTSEVSLHIYDKNARSQKVVSISKERNLEQDRNR